MNRRGWIIGAILLLALAAGIGLFTYFFEQVDEEIALPPKGEAAYNPLYALRKALQAHGVQARSYSSLSPAELALGTHDTLVLYTRPEALTAAQADRLLDWVGRGGHLVMPGPASAGDPGPLAARLGLKARFAKDTAGADAAGAAADDDGVNEDADENTLANCSLVSLDVADRAHAISVCGSRFVSASDEFQLADGDAERGYRFGRRGWGAGVVSVSALDFLDNRQLEKDAARELAYQLLAPRLGRGAVHLVYSADVPSLWRLLLLHGWPVLLPLALGLIAWLAWSSQRFGPVSPQAPAHRRALLEHVQAAGEFAFRRGRGIALHTSVLNLFKHRLQRRDPAMAALDGEALVQALSERLSLDAQRVRHALKPVAMQRPDSFLHSISTLLQMRNRL